uniref:hypothetical protein n=1 Tax=Salmonella sp. s55044 TaxID=3159677 RepID=UPI00397F10D9
IKNISRCQVTSNANAVPRVRNVAVRDRHVAKMAAAALQRAANVVTPRDVMTVPLVIAAVQGAVTAAPNVSQ